MVTLKVLVELCVHVVGLTCKCLSHHGLYVDGRIKL